MHALSIFFCMLYLPDSSTPQISFRLTRCFFSHIYPVLSTRLISHLAYFSHTDSFVLKKTCCSHPVDVAHRVTRPRRFALQKVPFLPYVAPAVTLCFPICQRIYSSVHRTPRRRSDRSARYLFSPHPPISPICRTPLFSHISHVNLVFEGARLPAQAQDCPPRSQAGEHPLRFRG